MPINSNHGLGASRRPNSLRHHLGNLRSTARFAASVASLPTQRRHVIRWLLSQRRNYLLEQPSPWITFDAIEYLHRFLKAESDQGKRPRVFEYGSGGSTLFWATLGAHCVSVEHDSEWFSIVQPRLKPAMVDYRLVVPELSDLIAPNPDPTDPKQYLSTGALYLGKDFRHYTQTIDAFPDEHFAVVLIDGRARPSCIMHAAPKVRPGGLLVLDNADREYYTRVAGSYLTAFTRRQFPGVCPIERFLTQTDVYEKRIR